jgi:hypothetical protein
MSILTDALSKIPYAAHRGEMTEETWTTLKGRIAEKHGANIDWWTVRTAVNRYLAARQNPNDSAVDVFNTVYEFEPIPFRDNHPDGTPKNGEIIQYIVALIVLVVIVLAGYIAILFIIMVVSAALMLGVEAVGRFLIRR